MLRCQQLHFLSWCVSFSDDNFPSLSLSPRGFYLPPRIFPSCLGIIALLLLQGISYSMCPSNAAAWLYSNRARDLCHSVSLPLLKLDSVPVGVLSAGLVSATLMLFPPSASDKCYWAWLSTSNDPHRAQTQTCCDRAEIEGQRLLLLLPGSLLASGDAD